MKPLVSVITVTFNAAGIVEETIRSVLNQTFANYEYLVIDGASTDVTVAVVEKFKGSLRLISEPDNGIYDAMNKAISLAKGDWIYFLNAGDLFYDTKVLESIFSVQYPEEINMIYGKVHSKNHPSGVDLIIGNQVGLEDFYYKVGLCHQAVFTNCRAFKNVGIYNAIDYKILADQEWFVRFFKKGMKAVYINRIIAWYEVTGLSSLQRRENHQEHLQVVNKHFSTRVKLLNNLRNPLVKLKISLLEKFNGTKLYRWYRNLSSAIKSDCSLYGFCMTCDLQF